MFSVPVMKPLSPQSLGEREAGSVGLTGSLSVDLEGHAGRSGWTGGGTTNSLCT